MNNPKCFEAGAIVTAIEAAKLPKGKPVAFIFCSSEKLVRETATFHLKLGFSHIFLFLSQPQQALAMEGVTSIAANNLKQSAVMQTLNQAKHKLLGRWVYWGYNAEFFTYPFFEDRSVADLAEFMTSEQRQNIFSMVLDLYADDLAASPYGFSLDKPCFDRIGYTSFASPDLAEIVPAKELPRAISIRGGLRWRMQEYLKDFPQNLERISFFQMTDDLHFDENGFTDRPEFYTCCCEHHRNTTASVLSFQAAIAMRHLPYVRDNVHSFSWGGSEKFSWTSPQLLRLGSMETGQWF